MRGLDAGEVYAYLDRLADQLQAMDHELSASRANGERLQAELQRVQAELDQYEQAGDRVNEQVVQMFSQAQLVVEEMVSDVSRDARERIGQAREHERRIVAEAMNTAGQQVRSYAETAQAQMQSIVSTFASEVGHLGTVTPTEPAADAFFTDDPHPRSRNGHAPGTPG
ncbi:DivIVA domain-containing protein [Kribbella sp. NPDC051770]|uniref:DivIVA domain-containing protein n=1 Tax=Kribbella sp. NPDC051770 TaxID=3155413 RepID=UPI0034381CEA